MQHVDTNHRAGERQVYIANLFWKPASSLSLLSLAFSLSSPHPIQYVWTRCPLPARLFSCCWSCDVLHGVSRELSVYLCPSCKGSSCVHALLWLNWWNVRALMRFLVCACVCACVLRACASVLYLCMFDCDSVGFLGACRMSIYWVSVDATALVSKNICPGVFRRLGHSNGSICFTDRWSLL